MEKKVMGIGRYRISPDQWQEIKEFGVEDDYDVVVETGTYRAVTTRHLSECFKKVYSIELSEILHKEALEICKDLGNVELIFGDSAKVLPDLEIPEPAIYYLDAHSCKTKPQVTAHTFPLWEELDFLAGRDYHDIIMVDDVGCFGHVNKRAKEASWAKVTFESIIARIESNKPVKRHMVVSNAFVVVV